MSDSQARPVATSAAPQGIGGWLLVFILTLVFFTPAAGIVAFLRSYGRALRVFAQMAHPYAYDLLYAGEQLTGLALCAYGIFAGMRLWKMRPAALMHAKRFLLLLVLFHLADFAMTLNFVWIFHPPGAATRYPSEGFFATTRNWVYPVLWYAYLVNSERVRRTFLSGQGASGS